MSIQYSGWNNENKLYMADGKSYAKTNSISVADKDYSTFPTIIAPVNSIGGRGERRANLTLSDRLAVYRPAARGTIWAVEVNINDRDPLLSAIRSAIRRNQFLTNRWPTDLQMGGTFG